MIYATIKYNTESLDGTHMPLWMYHPYPLYVLENNQDNICVIYKDNNEIISSYWFDKKYIETYL